MRVIPCGCHQCSMHTFVLKDSLVMIWNSTRKVLPKLPKLTWRVMPPDVPRFTNENSCVPTPAYMHIATPIKPDTCHTHRAHGVQLLTTYVLSVPAVRSMWVLRFKVRHTAAS